MSQLDKIYCPGLHRLFDSSIDGADEYIEYFLDDKPYAHIFYGPAKVRVSVFHALGRQICGGNPIVRILIRSEEAGNERIVDIEKHALESGGSSLRFIRKVKQQLNAAIICLLTEFFTNSD